VVLSSCYSGLGEFKNGEGIIGLGRGFINSGAKNAVFSLWKASDYYTMQFMVDFYSNFDVQGLSFSENLRKAKIKMINHFTHKGSRISAMMLFATLL